MFGFPAVAVTPCLVASDARLAAVFTGSLSSWSLPVSGNGYLEYKYIEGRDFKKVKEKWFNYYFLTQKAVLIQTFFRQPLSCRFKFHL